MWSNIKKVIKLFFLSFVFSSFALICSYYTHPEYVKLQASSFFPQIKITNYFFTFTKSCYIEKDYASFLNNNYRDYISTSDKLKFGDELKHSKEIKKYVENNRLVHINSSPLFTIDTLYYSFSFLTPKTLKLLNDISKSFQYQLQNTKFKGKIIHISSLLRTKMSIKKLRKKNNNSVRISSHLHGTTFDIDYLRYSFNNELSAYDVFYLKHILAKVLYQYKLQKRCFVTYEKNQSCFHVVLRE
ncbi:MAG: hypothetical protein HYU67_04895 [Flavobacteriia bacterium]|nr:hypothetical protein [Flavobacteriia bacterium]